MQVAVAHRGFVHLEVETHGRAAHGSRPHLGIDAIAKMGRVLVGIEELDRRLRANPTHPYVGSGSVHASLIEGGQEFSSYPARCLLQAERRTIPGETVALAEQELAGDRRASRRGRSGLLGGRPRSDLARAVRGRGGRRDRRGRAPACGGRPRRRAGASSACRSGPTRRSSRRPASRPCSSARAARARTPRSSGSTSPRSSSASRSTSRSRLELCA